MDDSSNICLSCGLCCDGTILGFVQLDNDEMPALKKIMDIEDEKGNGFFLQPCKKYCDGCTIYSQRPKQCGLFECGLLKSVEKKEIKFESALEIVNVVKQKRSAIAKNVALLNIELHSPSFYFRMVELKKLLEKNKAESSLTQNHLELIADLAHLDGLLSNEFDVSVY